MIDSLVRMVGLKVEIEGWIIMVVMMFLIQRYLMVPMISIKIY